MLAHSSQGKYIHDEAALVEGDWVAAPIASAARKLREMDADVHITVYITLCIICFVFMVFLLVYLSLINFLHNRGCSFF